MARDRELTTLRIRSLVADKEMVVAQANLSLARAGEWAVNYAEWSRQYAEWSRQIDSEIQALIASLGTEADK